MPAGEKPEEKVEETPPPKKDGSEETPAPKPKPQQAKGVGGTDDAFPAFLDEWGEYKTEVGWMPKSKRPPLKPAEPTIQQDPAPKHEHTNGACVFDPFCPFKGD